MIHSTVLANVEIPSSMFDAKFLFASLIWGSVGVGYCVYGKKQQEIVPFVAGVAMIAVSYLISSALLMSLISIALIAAAYLVMKRG